LGWSSGRNPLGARAGEERLPYNLWVRQDDGDTVTRPPERSSEASGATGRQKAANLRSSQTTMARQRGRGRCARPPARNRRSPHPQEQRSEDSAPRIHGRPEAASLRCTGRAEIRRTCTYWRAPTRRKHIVDLRP
jgi:hypothetical protein